MRFFEGLNALDYPPKGSATLQEGGTTLLIRRVEFIPGRLLPSRAYFRFTQQGKFPNKKLHLQPVEKTNHLPDYDVISTAIVPFKGSFHKSIWIVEIYGKATDQFNVIMYFENHDGKFQTIFEDFLPFDSKKLSEIDYE